MSEKDFDYDYENRCANGGQHQVLQSYAIATRIPLKLTLAWMRKQKPADIAHLSLDELQSEAVLAVFSCIPRFKAGKGSLFRYARMPVFEALDIFRGQSRSPVQLPQKVARKLGRDLHGEEYHTPDDGPYEEIAD
jgi:hypothetical protein